MQVYSARASKDRGKAQATKHISFAPEAQDVGKPIPAVYGGSPAQQRQRQRPPPHVMDYTVKAGMRPLSQVRSMRRCRSTSFPSSIHISLGMLVTLLCLTGSYLPETAPVRVRCTATAAP